MCVDVEADCQVFAHLNVKLLDTILAKDAEETLVGILSWYLNHILLRHP